MTVSETPKKRLTAAEIVEQFAAHMPPSGGWLSVNRTKWLADVAGREMMRSGAPVRGSKRGGWTRFHIELEDGYADLSVSCVNGAGALHITRHAEVQEHIAAEQREIELQKSLGLAALTFEQLREGVAKFTNLLLRPGIEASMDEASRQVCQDIIDDYQAELQRRAVH